MRVAGLLVLASCSAAACHRGGFDEPSRYNVIVVSFDALRADALPIYGNRRNTAPRMTAFASTAVTFDNAQSAAPTTPTSFAAAFSGRYPFRVFRSWRFLADNPVASLFQHAGYATAFFTTNVQLTKTRGFDRGFQTYELLLNPSADDPEQIPDDDQVLRTALEWLEQKRQTPFFLWIHFLSPHAPYSRRPDGTEFYDKSYVGPFAETSGLDFTADTPPALARIRDLYDGEVRHADNVFGRLLARLETWQLLDRTVLVLTADHGEEFLEHGQLQHVSLYREVTHIPLIVHHPGVRRPSRVAVPVSNVDLLPSLAKWTGLPPPPGLDGVPLDLAPPADRVLLSAAMTAPGRFGIAVLQGTTKALVDCQGQPTAFYDLQLDPGELHDVSGARSPQLQALLAKARVAAGGQPCDAMQQALTQDIPTPALDADTLERLRALGYTAPAGGRAGAAVLAADPDPILDCDQVEMGSTRITWWVPGEGRKIEVRAGSADGQLFAKGEGPGQGATGPWVRDGMVFYLVDAVSRKVLATRRVHVVPCGQATPERPRQGPS